MKRYIKRVILSELAILCVWGVLIWVSKKYELNCSIAEVTLSLLTIMGSVVAGYIAWYQWRNSCEVKRAETLMELLKLFKENDLCKKVHSGADDEKESSMKEWYDKAMHLPESKDKALSSVRLICYLQYLKNRELIGANEEVLFKTAIDAVINNEWFQKFMKEEPVISDEMRQTIMSIKGYKEYKVVSEAETIDDTTEEKEMEISFDEIDSSQFTENTMIIKINRMYRENISERELYEATRGWWRVNVNKAKEMKFVLSVANGVVKEVYEDIKWNEKDEESGRSAFTGKPTTDTYWKKFIGKSVRGLFTRGESNPIKYFYGNNK